MESFLGRLVRRNCNYHVVFFDHHSRLCVPPHASARDASKYLLARSAIIRHLSQHLPDVQPLIEIHTFSSIQDDQFADYLKNAGIYFIMCHDGTEFSQKGQYLSADASNQDAVTSRDGHAQMRDFKVLIWWSIRAGYNVALINGIEWRDTKVGYNSGEGAYQL